jgi:hypothetical protein
VNTETAASRKNRVFRLSPDPLELLYRESLLSDLPPLPLNTLPGFYRPPPGVLRGLVAGIALGLFSVGVELFVEHLGDSTPTVAAAPPRTAGPSVTLRK